MTTNATVQGFVIQAPGRLRLALDAMLSLYSLIPVALLGTFYTFVLRARWELGRWPLPMFPDPKSLKFPGAETHYEAVYWLGVFTICCALPWLLTFILRIHGMPRKTWHYLLSLPWLVLVLIIAFDPGDYLGWFMD